MIEYAQELFDTNYGSWTTTRNEDGTGSRHRIVTGGWSNNEAVVSALSRTMLHSMAWAESHRGGLHVYEVLDAWSEPTWDSFDWGNLISPALKFSSTWAVLNRALEGLSVDRDSLEIKTWPADERDEYNSNGGFTEGRNAVRALRIRKVAQQLFEKL